MSTLPTKMTGGQLLLPVWKPERVFNLAALEVNIEDTEVGDTPKSGRTYSDLVTVQLWMAETKDSEYVCIGEVLLNPGSYRGFSLCGYINDYGFEEVVRIPSTAQVVAVTDAFSVDAPGGETNTKPQIDLKPLGAFL